MIVQTLSWRRHERALKAQVEAYKKAADDWKSVAATWETAAGEWQKASQSFERTADEALAMVQTLQVTFPGRGEFDDQPGGSDFKLVSVARDGTKSETFRITRDKP